MFNVVLVDGNLLFFINVVLQDSDAESITDESDDDSDKNSDGLDHESDNDESGAPRVVRMEFAEEGDTPGLSSAPPTPSPGENYFEILQKF